MHRTERVKLLAPQNLESITLPSCKTKEAAIMTDHH